MLNTIRLHNEQAAYLSLERLVWPSGPACPHCGELCRLGRLNGLSTAVGTWKCYACRKPFTIRNGTIFHNSHVPLHVWLQALYLLSGPRPNIGSQRLARILGVSVRTAWQLKQKVATGLEANARDAGRFLPWRDDITVIRCDSPDCQPSSGPGSAVSEARYRRFVAVVEGGATAETDLHFVEALHRLLGLRHDGADEAFARMSFDRNRPNGKNSCQIDTLEHALVAKAVPTFEEHAPAEEQLELGLLACGDAQQQAVATARASQAQLQMKG